MEAFRSHLQQEFMRRSSKNPNYSLRAFAQHLGFNHATLSTLLSGKRTITKNTVLKISQALGMSPKEISHFVSDVESGNKGKSTPYYLLQNDAFSLISEWYCDAILELSLIRNIQLTPKNISAALGITSVQAKLALETLERLELLIVDEAGSYTLQHQNSSNILDPDFTTAAQKKHQQVLLEKSIEALETVDRKERDHTSTTMAINTNDLPKVKALIQKFRHDLNKYLQRKGATPNEVYQLQVAFFPLSKLTKNRSEK